ncbi:MAG: hypothetical protein PHF37_09585 [Phycisphaerae bacterium]|nr:hypothetical protein [Phycisphaerae bacterium]
MNISEFNKKRAFTIVELLTVMSIIVILITLLIPALNKVRHYARDVKQRAQLHSIEAALEQFNAEVDGYPPSVDNANLTTPLAPYCGAMKLAEALLGKDLQGYNPRAKFISDLAQNEGVATTGYRFYPTQADKTADPVKYDESIRSRKGPYLQLENANAYRMKNIYPATADQIYVDNVENYVLCDVYGRVTLLDPDSENIYGKTGMPILYYKANTYNTGHDPNVPDELIYDYKDNDDLVVLGAPWDDAGTIIHPLHQVGTGTVGEKFYKMTRNTKISGDLPAVPVRKDSYILISAGNDGLYGTGDDITNF